MLYNIYKICYNLYINIDADIFYRKALGVFCMLEFLKYYPGNVEINGEEIDKNSISDILESKYGKITIRLIPNNKSFENIRNAFTEIEKPIKNSNDLEYTVLVKPWMTVKSTPDFIFMLTWNNDIPMPFRFMQGKINKETRGMFNMTLHGSSDNPVVCSVCGKTLTNPISKLYGIGPECMQKCGIFPDISIEQAKDNLDEIKSRIQNTTWTGWIAKSAIVEMMEVNN